MLEIRRRPHRTTPRQAISVLYREPPPWATELALPLALDLLGAAVAVNGVTLFLTVEHPHIAHELAGELPFGVGALVVPFDLDDPAGLVRPFAERDFARLLLVAADAIGITARLLTTGLSVLQHDPVVLGPAATGGAYLAGANLHATAAAGNLTLCLRAMLGDGGPLPPTVRKLERRSRLSGLADLDAVRELAADHAREIPRTWAHLRESTAP